MDLAHLARDLKILSHLSGQEVSQILPYRKAQEVPNTHNALLSLSFIHITVTVELICTPSICPALWTVGAQINIVDDEGT